MYNKHPLIKSKTKIVFHKRDTIILTSLDNIVKLTTKDMTTVCNTLESIFLSTDYLLFSYFDELFVFNDYNKTAYRVDTEDAKVIEKHVEHNEYCILLQCRTEEQLLLAKVMLNV